uniref:calcium-binding protein n=1 Tax=uncultured Rhizobium sp. TaxID=155567 RepID=UPI002609EB2E|nr:calcium-binding protein [uncultured Rhizobium sp.]
MAITISASDDNKDGTGINFTSYLRAFEKTFESTGYGGFSGATSGDVYDADNPLGAKSYVTTNSESDGGDSVIFNASGKFVYDFYNGHVISGKLSSLVFGSDTVTKALTGDDVKYSNSGDITISGLGGIATSSKSGDIMGDIMDGITDSLTKLLASDSIIFKGSTGNDVFSGYSHNDKINGGAGKDTLNGAAGKDRLDGDAGNDVLTGGAGADTFYFAKNDGSDKIRDFEEGRAGKDVIEFQKGLFDNYADIIDHAVEKAGNTVISYDGGKLTLVGVGLDDLHKSDFHLL